MYTIVGRDSVQNRSQLGRDSVQNRKMYWGRIIKNPPGLLVNLILIFQHWVRNKLECTAPLKRSLVVLLSGLVG